MATSWTLSIDESAPVSLEALGVYVADWTVRTLAASSLRLKRHEAFDVPDQFNHGDSVVLYRDGVGVFRGKVVSQPRKASSDSEEQHIEVLDAWDDLERTTYMESWSIHGGSVMMPRAILGMNASGVSIDTGQQIRDAVNYANGNGCSIQLGNVSSGHDLWPSQVNNISVAEVIRRSMRFHPDRVAWLDYSSSPATLNVTDQANAPLLSFPVDGSEEVSEFDVRPVDERVPDAIRIVYESVDNIAGVTARNVSIDRWPASGPDAGPKVMNATLKLAGMRATIQSQAVETRDMPTDQASAKFWLEAKFPKLTDLPPDSYDVVIFERSVVNDGPQPDPVNPNATRLAVGDVSELPRELVSGQIMDWMQVKVRKVEVTVEMRFKPAASPPDWAKHILPSGPQKIIAQATNATTKVYRGLASFTPSASAPTGIAQTIYQSLATTQHQGSIVVSSDEVLSGQILGKGIVLTGGRPEWLNMKALVNEVNYDIARGQTTIHFGPPTQFAPGWSDLQRALRKRRPKWIRSSSRISQEIEDDGSEVTGGYDPPTTEILSGASGDPYELRVWEWYYDPSNYPDVLDVPADPTHSFFHYPDGRVLVKEWSSGFVTPPDDWDAAWPAHNVSNITNGYVPY